jgi:carbon-monoxide dehydrogenase small subunit
MRHEITVTVNGLVETHTVSARDTLLTFLRDTLDLTGAKEGCNEGECGACIVLVDGRPTNSCLMLAVESDGTRVTTIEGLGGPGRLHPVQEAFLKHHAVQCGYCTPGMIMTAVGLLEENPDPTEEDVRRALAGNLCRCTGYRQIIDAVLDAAAALRRRTATALIERTA